MITIAQVATALQTALGPVADRAARATGFVQALAFGWLAQPRASLPQLVQAAATVGVPISRKGWMIGSARPRPTACARGAGCGRRHQPGRGRDRPWAPPARRPKAPGYRSPSMNANPYQSSVLSPLTKTSPGRKPGRGRRAEEGGGRDVLRRGVACGRWSPLW
jgi:hypothetical protein